ncbi:MAG: glycosyltransferase family 4 protein [Planctomycetaceae bacterium]|nr:glycosyltransferase family 4 protein [Planctomycetaceae bacterium]
MPDPVERVLFLTHDLTFRGSSILLLRQAQGMEALGIETIVLCTRMQKLEPGLTEHVNVITVPGYGVPLWGRVVGRSVLSQLIDQPPDVIHVHGPAMLSQALFLGRTLGRPVVLTLTDQTEAARVVLSSGSDVCRAIICVSESVRAALPPRLDQIEQRVIPPGVSLDQAADHPPILEGDRLPVVGIAGPLEVIKGGSFFLRACHRVIDSGTEIRIVVVGSGPEEKNLRKLATSLELDDHITFVDDGTAMTAYLTAIDIFCLPSLQQGFGVIMLEAMALGRPAIASGVGGVLSILEDGQNGFVVPPSDSRVLADRILQLLGDHKLAARIAIAGQNLVEDRFTKERMVHDVLALFAEITESGRQEPATISIEPREGTGV